MHRSTQRWHSRHLGQEMTFRTYGDRGKPAIIFPAQEGHYMEYEDFQMVAAVESFIESGQLRLFCVDSWDAQAWCNHAIPPRERARHANLYERYIIDELVPCIREQAGPQKLMFSGCSMGGYHAANFFFRNPDVADTVVALSGVYDLTLFIDNAMDDEIFYHVPLSYLPGLHDPWYLERFRQADIVLCVGQGAWEDPMLPQTRRMHEILGQLDVPAWVDIWGQDVSHDWPWWRKQMPHFLKEIFRPK